MAPPRNPEYVYRENDTKRKHPYIYKECEGCGEVKLIGARNAFCSRTCSLRAQHAAGPRATMPSGAEHYKWMESGTGYAANHARVLRARGPAVHCENRAEAGCASIKYEWAHVHGTDPGDPANYRSLCKSCHIAYDEQRGSGHANAKLSPQQVSEIRVRYGTGRISQEVLAAEYNVHQTVISAVVTGKRYLAS